MATSDEEVMKKISEEMAQYYNKNFAKFGPMGKTASDSNAVTEDAAREGTVFGTKAGTLGSGMGSIMGTGQAAAQAAAAQEAAKVMGAGQAARKQAQMAELFQPAGMGMGMAPGRMPKMYKGGGKVSKSGRSYRGYGKARIPS
jgi:hypothetical protein